jgi:hypothetical protein
MIKNGRPIYGRNGRHAMPHNRPPCHLSWVIEFTSSHCSFAARLGPIAPRCSSFFSSSLGSPDFSFLPPAALAATSGCLPFVLFGDGRGNFSALRLAACCFALLDGFHRLEMVTNCIVRGVELSQRRTLAPRSAAEMPLASSGRSHALQRRVPNQNGRTVRPSRVNRQAPSDTKVDRLMSPWATSKMNMTTA